MIEITGCCDFCGRKINGSIDNFCTVYFDLSNRMKLIELAICKKCLGKITGESGCFKYQLESVKSKNGR